MSKESRLLKNTAIIGISNLCTKGVSFLLLPLYTAIMSAEEYGTVDIITSYTSLFTVLVTLQMEQAVFRFLVEVRGDLQKQKQHVTAALTVVLLTLSVFLLIAATFLREMRYDYTLYFLANCAGSVLMAVILQVPRGLGDNLTYAIASCVSGSLNVLLNVVFVAVLRLGVEGMLTAGVISTTVSVLYVVFRVKLYTFVGKKWLRMDCVRTMLYYALPLIPYTMCWWIIDASDRVIINLSLGVAANGIYAVANKFPSLFRMASNIFQTAWMESAFENVDDINRNQYYKRTINTAVRFYSSCNIGLIAVMPFVFNFFVDAEYLEAYGLIPILTTAVMFHSVSAMYGAVFFAFKQTKEIALSIILPALINIGVNYLLINEIGLYAAAGSTLLVHVILVIQRYYKFRELCDIRISGSYLVGELIVYACTFFAYYSGNRFVQGVVLMLVVAHCFAVNRETICKMIGAIGRKLYR